MTPSPGNILVEFEYDRKRSLVEQDNGLVIPERFLIQEADEEGEHDAYGVTTDRKLINPQIVKILSGDHIGKKAFVYYGTFEVAKWIDDKQAIIRENTIFFYIDPIETTAGTYLGEEVFTEGEKTASGIYTTPFAEKKEGIKVLITHIPAEKRILYYNNVDMMMTIQHGDTVITIDNNQYDLIFCGKKYIKLRDREIIGVETVTGVVPIGDTVLVEYLPDDDHDERIAENDRRRERRDLITKFHLHVSAAHAQGNDPDLMDLPEPKFVNVKILHIGDGCRISASIGDTLLAFRNFGCILPDKKWIIGQQAIVGVFFK